MSAKLQIIIFFSLWIHWLCAKSDTEYDANIVWSNDVVEHTNLDICVILCFPASDFWFCCWAIGLSHITSSFKWKHSLDALRFSFYMQAIQYWYHQQQQQKHAFESCFRIVQTIPIENFVRSNLIAVVLGI